VTLSISILCLLARVRRIRPARLRMRRKVRRTSGRRTS